MGTLLWAHFRDFVFDSLDGSIEAVGEVAAGGLDILYVARHWMREILSKVYGLDARATEAAEGSVSFDQPAVDSSYLVEILRRSQKND